MAKKTFEYIWQFLRENNCDGLDNVTDEIRCTICRKILIDPCFGCCGCKYCLACITEYLNGQQKFCPGNASDCKEELLDLCNLGHPDYPTSQKISKLIVKCPRDGCEWRCELRELEAHERVCKSSETINCPYGNIGCQESQLTNDMMNAHLIDRNELHAQLLMECIDTLRNENGSMKRDLADARAQKQDQERLEDQHATGMLEYLNQEMQLMKQEMRSMREENKSILKEILSMKDQNKSIIEDNKLIKEGIKSIKDANNSLKSGFKQIQTDHSRLVESMEELDNQMSSIELEMQALKEIISIKKDNGSISVKDDSELMQIRPQSSGSVRSRRPKRSGNRSRGGRQMSSDRELSFLTRPYANLYKGFYSYMYEN